MSSPSTQSPLSVFRFVIGYDAKDAATAEHACSAAIEALTEGTQDGFAGHIPDWLEYERSGLKYWLDVDFPANDLEHARELSDKAVDAINEYGKADDGYQLSPAEA